MELCPRCTSTVEDDAVRCGVCAAPIWQPVTSTSVAVTPAPVALVLPVPPSTASPPPLSDLPPQRLPSPRPVPSPDVSATVLPTAHGQNHWLTGAGAVVAILVVVVLIFALPAHGAKHSRPPMVAANSAQAQFDLRALANAEETNLTATRFYTTDGRALASAGYAPLPGAPVTILAGVSRKSAYCLVATAGRTSPWFLYDSMQGGLVNDSFTSRARAQHACTDSTIASYAPVS
ncbi:MAG TPA: hypothetical protein VHC43_10875 [Mycobacteriales bacterium]|nr:hypothetical protein [Mycobacteriales bacterium]